MKSRIIALCIVLLLPQIAQAAADSLAETKAVSDNNAFAVDLYGQLRKQNGNLFFSPESISVALAMTYAGARGDTATAMAKTLHFTLPPEQLHSAMGALLRSMNAAHTDYVLKAANALWTQKDYDFLMPFMDLMKKDYGGSFYGVDFKTGAEPARQAINAWAASQTEQKIIDLLPGGTLTPKTRLVLTNAIYFKGDWNAPFDKAQTRDEDFHASATQQVKTPLMHRNGAFPYYDGETFQALEIPYKGKELSMILFLPQAVDGLPVFEQTLTPEKIQQWLRQLRPATYVSLTIPKFKMTQQLRLAATLAAMGMKQAFDPVHADFTGMTPKAEMQRQDGPNANLYIRAVIHKAYADVDEQGTEAAAATAVVMHVMKTVAAQPNPRIIFRADHPFLFLIRDNRSGSILFMGRMENPAQ